MRRLIVGTAGHIDHGKTRLIEALTGIDCDRWAEEKRRGITIDLGFAHLERGDLQIGFIDVPGHQRFLHNALAGLGGIRLVLLVVAADEGVKPQTREHLQICSLLGIPAALVALTKSDLATPDLLELARLEVEELLAATRFAGAPILAVSSATGSGLPALEAELLALAAPLPVPDEPGLPARLPLDRAFHLKGLGVVVTGTLASGTVRAGDALEVLPGGATVRVRNLQVHGHPREAALAGERAALQLTGIELPALERGQQLVTPGALAPATSLLGRFTLLAEAPVALRGWTSVTLHLLAAEVPGRLRPLAGTIEPGGTGPVELRLARPLAAVRGDRFVARRPSPAATLGGGEVLDPRWRRHRGTLLEHALAALNAGQREAIGWWLREAGEAGLDEAEIAQRLGRPRPEIAATLRLLARELGALAVEGGRGARRWISPGSFERVQRRAARVLQDYFRADRLATAMPKAEAVRRMFRGRAGELADVYLDWLAGLNVLAIAGDRVTLPGRTAELTGEESRLARAALTRFEAAGLQPPSPGEVRQELGAKREILDGVLRHLVKRGQLVQLPGGLIAAASAIGTLRDELAATGWERFSVPQFKDRFGLSRKWAIPLLEHLDSVGATRRMGDERMIVKT